MFRLKWDDLKNLPANRVTDFQGAPVMVVGFLSHQVKVDTGGESTNCHLHSPDEVDWHMYLTNSPRKALPTPFCRNYSANAPDSQMDHNDSERVRGQLDASAN